MKIKLSIKFLIIFTILVSSQAYAVTKLEFNDVYNNFRKANPPDCKNYFESLLFFANEGNSVAMNTVGFCFTIGWDGHPINKKLANEWYLKSAAKGNSLAKINLASADKSALKKLLVEFEKEGKFGELNYLKSLMEKDQKKSLDFLKKSADLEFPEAVRNCPVAELDYERKIVKSADSNLSWLEKQIKKQEEWIQKAKKLGVEAHPKTIHSVQQLEYRIALIKKVQAIPDAALNLIRSDKNLLSGMKTLVEDFNYKISQNLKSNNKKIEYASVDFIEASRIEKSQASQFLIFKLKNQEEESVAFSDDFIRIYVMDKESSKVSGFLLADERFNEPVNLDVAKFDLNESERAFGFRSKYTSYGSGSGEAGTQLSIFRFHNSFLHLVFQEEMEGETYEEKGNLNECVDDDGNEIKNCKTTPPAGSSFISILNVLPTKTNGFFDWKLVKKIKVDRIENGKAIQDIKSEIKIFHWNGERYVGPKIKK